MLSFVTWATLSPKGLLFCIPSTPQTMPGLHGTHKDCSVRPVKGLQVPMGQFLHVIESLKDLYVPGPQMLGLKVPSR